MKRRPRIKKERGKDGHIDELWLRRKRGDERWSVRSRRSGDINYRKRLDWSQGGLAHLGERKDSFSHLCRVTFFEARLVFYNKNKFSVNGGVTVHPVNLPLHQSREESSFW